MRHIEILDFKHTLKLSSKKTGAAIFLMAASLYISPLPGYSTSKSNPPEERYMQLADTASAYMDRGEWEKAARYITTALQENPGHQLNPMMFSNLGVCQNYLGQYANALQSFEIALIKAPRSAKVLTNRARTYLAMNNEESAKADLDIALTENPGYAEALRLRSLLLLQRKDYPRAEADFRELEKRGDADALTYAYIGKCLIAKGEPEEASRYWKKALEENPDAYIFTTIAHFEIEADDIKSAEETIRQGLKQYPREGMLYLLRGVTHKIKFQNEDAEIDKKLSIKYGVDPQTVEQYLPEEGGRSGRKR